MSSRNTLLSPDERQGASIIYQGLRDAKIAFREGERNALKLADIVRQKIETEPFARIDYVAVVDSETLAPVDKIGDAQVLIAVAARFGLVRLIDNIIINRKQ
jgi:pantoate--beta-alanine ligase